MLKPWTPLSFEFFPPRSDTQQERFDHAWAELARLRPEYFSVTFGAGGSTLEATHRSVIALQGASGVPVAPHLSCMVPNRGSVRQYLADYQQAGVRRLVVLRGDRPAEDAPAGPFEHADELVRFIREETGDHFSIEVACYPEMHPESESPQTELEFFRQKVDAGANGAITQYFYNADAYFRFIDECQRRGILVPIRPGVLPITNREQLLRFSRQCGAEVPRWIERRLDGFGDDLASIRAFGLDVVTGLCERLLRGGAPGLHIYSLNQSAPSLELVSRLGGIESGGNHVEKPRTDSPPGAINA
ncbi:MAG: methylenetetrahydrofolate reductase [NAD(P)H] [Xanthomonadales bacterium]|nr:methylenetetrahydrofolate reductase [NAD(P)H] [Xanthomonadales bacterium]